ncbi:unnamed protein product, partial [Mesorhabditis spiculigera]
MVATRRRKPNLPTQTEKTPEDGPEEELKTNDDTKDGKENVGDLPDKSAENDTAVETSAPPEAVRKRGKKQSAPEASEDAAAKRAKSPAAQSENSSKPGRAKKTVKHKKAIGAGDSGATPPKRLKVIDEAMETPVPFDNSSDSETEQVAGSSKQVPAKKRPERRDVEMVPFENTPEPEEQKKETKPKTSPIKKRPQRRSTLQPKSYAQKNDDSSFSDLSSEESVFDTSAEEVIGKKGKRVKKHQSSSEDDDEEEVDEPDATPPPKPKKKQRPQGVVRYRTGAAVEVKQPRASSSVPSSRPITPASGNSSSNPLDAGDPSTSSAKGVGRTIGLDVKAEQVREKQWVLDCFRLFKVLARDRNDEMSIDEAAELVYVLKKHGSIYTWGRIATGLQRNKHYLDAERVAQKEAPVAEPDYKSSSEDEWEEMEELDEPSKKPAPKKVEIHFEKRKAEINWEVKWLRQEVNKHVRAKYENAHRIHLLAWIGFLRRNVKQVLHEQLVPSLALTNIPSSYSNGGDEPITDELARKFAKWIHQNFKVVDEIKASKEEWDCRWDETARAATSIRDRCFDSDLQRALAYFVLFRAVNLETRLVANCDVVSRKKDDGGKKQPAEKKKKKKAPSIDVFCDFWIEYWSKGFKKWMCVNPITGEVDNPTEFEAKFSQPVHARNYVFGCSNNGQVRDVGARYLAAFGTPNYRRARTDQEWLDRVFRAKVIRADRTKAELEEMYFMKTLAGRPLPKSIAEYKDHPLYVLEKDLLKFEAIYPPPDVQKPIGQVRGLNVYPRSTVFHLQGDLNWIKLARSIKEGEKPYKIVKARPNSKTEPYKVPVVVDGRIPRNQYDNIYVYRESMIPDGCVHLNLPGIVQICRKAQKEHVAAVVGWDFHGGSNHPIIEGAVVLEKDADKLVFEWEAMEQRRREREDKRRRDRVRANWHKLVFGILRLRKLERKFGRNQGSNESKQKAETKDELADEEVEAENAAAWPAAKFTLR